MTSPFDPRQFGTAATPIDGKTGITKSPSMAIDETTRVIMVAIDASAMDDNTEFVHTIEVSDDGEKTWRLVAQVPHHGAPVGRDGKPLAEIVDGVRVTVTGQCVFRSSVNATKPLTATLDPRKQ